MNDIQIVSKAQVTRLRKLQKKKYRDELRLYLAEGERTIEQIIQNNPEMVAEIYVDQSCFAQFVKKTDFTNAEAAVRLIPTEVFAELTDTDNPQGIVAVCKMPEEAKLKNMLSGARGYLLALDRIQDPGNMGTIIRTAAWFGVEGLILAKGNVDIFHPKVVRSTAGATGILPYLTGDLNMIFEQFERAGWQIGLLALDQDAQSLPAVEPGNKFIMTLGNEANGIDPGLFTKDRIKIFIPGDVDKNQVESLNAAVANGIALYDLFRKLILK